MREGFYTLTWIEGGNYGLPPSPEFTQSASDDFLKSKETDSDWARLVFPICSQGIIVRCIDSIEYQDSEAVWRKSKFHGYLPVSVAPTVTPGSDRYVKWAEKDIDLYAGGLIPSNSARSSLWEVVNGSKKTLLMANVSIGYDFYFKRFLGLRLRLTPVKEVEVSEPNQYKQLDPERTWCARTGYADSFFANNNFHPLEEVNTQTGLYDYCLVKDEFPSTVKYRITTSLSTDIVENQFANWVSSRTSETRAFTTSSKDGRSTKAVFEGIPVIMQSAVTEIPHTKEGFEDYLAGRKKWWDQIVKNGTQTKESLMKNWGVDGVGSGGESGISNGWESVELWRTTEKYVNPLLTKEEQVWSFNLLELMAEEDAWINKCRKEQSSTIGFSGVVSTNATVFVESPPQVDAGGNLDFRIAATHLKANGEKNLGTYDLSISTALGKCLWGSSISPNATISVVSEDGTRQLATTSISESNSQIHFSAAGFHYSVNRIQITNPKKIVASSKTLTCTKGKQVKKLTGANPKCPKGFKRS